MKSTLIAAALVLIGALGIGGSPAHADGPPQRVVAGPAHLRLDPPKEIKISFGTVWQEGKIVKATIACQTGTTVKYTFPVYVTDSNGGAWRVYSVTFRLGSRIPVAQSLPRNWVYKGVVLRGGVAGLTATWMTPGARLAPLGCRVSVVRS